MTYLSIVSPGLCGNQIIRSNIAKTQQPDAERLKIEYSDILGIGSIRTLAFLLHFLRQFQTAPLIRTYCSRWTNCHFRRKSGPENPG